MLLLAASVVTAGVTGLVFGVFTCLLILASVRYQFDPDNIASPLVASLGDLFTLFMLSITADAAQALESAFAAAAARSQNVPHIAWRATIACRATPYCCALQ